MLLVSVAVVLSMIFIERTIGFHTVYRVGDVDAVAAVVIFGIPIYTLVSVWITRFKVESFSKFGSHLQQSILMYCLLIGMGFLLIVYRNENGGLGYAYGALLFCASFVGVLVNGCFHYFCNSGTDTAA